MRLLESRRNGLRAVEIHELLDGSVTERTVFRDLRDLQDAGFPLYDEDGRWRIQWDGEGGFSIPASPSEFLSLLFSEELLAPLRSSEFVSALGTLREKVAAMLTPEGRRYAEELKEHLLATFVGPGDYGDNRILGTIEDAIQREHRVRIQHWSPGRAVTERTVDPYLMWYADARLYLVGWCHLRDSVRTFLVDRIRSIEMLDEDFEPNPAFDPRKFAGSGLGAWSGEPQRVELEFTPAVAHLAYERRFHPTQQLTELESGAVMVTMHVAGMPHVAAWVASFGGRIIARSPGSLIEMIQDTHRRGLAALDDGPLKN